MSSAASENVADMFSRLPEEILSHILSLMPTKFAVQTSVLSKRWRYSWMFVTNIDFDDSHDHHFNGDTFTIVADQLEKTCKTFQLNLFRLHLFNTRVHRSGVSNWIDKAVRLNVHELDIGINKLQLPLSVFTSKTLTKLRISRKSCHYMDWKCPSFVNLPCLKTLDIAGHRSSIVNVFKLIDGCPVLESLSLEVTRHTNKKDYMFNIPTLKRLKLTYRSCTNNVINKVVLRVPNLEYLLVSGVLCSYFVMEDVSSLSRVLITCGESTFNHLWVNLLNMIRGVQNLSIQNFPFTTSLPIFPNMKHLELKGYLQARLIPQFLRRCPKLKSLCIDAVSKVWRIFFFTCLTPFILV
ncbi:putative F-box domain, leucine-rich repeat domain superfamily, F-box-like domain superfamily [Helianthus annuus]|nr:putative F-box domain, leucine-rich repeat domain superfamily, F-box-like domain superfamily [Helianthus annuus]